MVELPEAGSYSAKFATEFVKFTHQAFFKFRWLLFLDTFGGSFHCGE